MSKRTTSRLTSLILVLILVAGAGLIWLNRQNIYDWYRLRNYTPPAEVAQLATETTMTPYARRLFYVYHPAIESKVAFNQNCPNSGSQQSSVLGCTVYNHGIYLYNVQDPQLNGIVQVTAAYEMLHVGYMRLSKSKRQQIDQLVMQAYNQAKASDSQLQVEEQSYLHSEGSAAVPNELHSMMGTEVANLPSALENYYKQYFTSRQTVVNFDDQYQQVFTSRQDQITNYENQLSGLKQQINNNEADLNAQQASLKQQQQQLNSYLASNQIDAYNSGIVSYNQQVNDYDGEISTTQALISQYNVLANQLNSLAVQTQQLIQEINSNVLNTQAPQ
jgi:hypothetical protein